jgi:hypothetical protein
MRRITITTSILGLLLIVGIIKASSAHFLKATGIVDTGTGDYVASFKEAGLGSTPVTYELVATPVSFTFQCFTKSGHQPQGEPNSVSFSTLSSFTTLTPRNGQITGSVSLSPELGGASCQGGGLQLFLTAVNYGIPGGTVTLTDTTNSVSVTLPTISASGLNIGPF